MTTDNRTNEQIVAELVNRRNSFMTSVNPALNAEAIIEALRAAGRLAGRLAGGPTEAQVELAAKALEQMPIILFATITRDDARKLARAALVAAAGAGKEKNE